MERNPQQEMQTRDTDSNNNTEMTRMKILKKAFNKTLHFEKWPLRGVTGPQASDSWAGSSIAEGAACKSPITFSPEQGQGKRHQIPAQGSKGCALAQ